MIVFHLGRPAIIRGFEEDGWLLWLDALTTLGCHDKTPSPAYEDLSSCWCWAWFVPAATPHEAADPGHGSTLSTRPNQLAGVICHRLRGPALSAPAPTFTPQNSRYSVPHLHRLPSASVVSYHRVYTRGTACLRSSIAELPALSHTGELNGSNLESCTSIPSRGPRQPYKTQRDMCLPSGTSAA